MTQKQDNDPQAPAEGSDQIPPPNPGSPRKEANDERDSRAERKPDEGSKS